MLFESIISPIYVLGIGNIFLALFLTLAGYYILFRPLNRVKDLCDTGYSEPERYGRTKRQVANEVRRLKKKGELPPVYPNGWFALCESFELKAGQVLPVYALGQNLVVFRTEEGTVCVLDAYCPHLGAHLGIGGRVVGDCIECPFHGWQFDGADGKCTKIPYTVGKVPPSAQVKKWLSEEVNGFIFFWYHAEDAKPDWKVPVLKKIANGEWSYRGRSDYKVNAHIQEIPENGADVAHLAQLHGPSMLYGSNLQSISEKNRKQEKSQGLPILHHHWTVSWKGPEPEDECQHIAIAELTHDFRLFDWISLMKMKVEVQQIGPGLVHLVICNSLGTSVFVQTVTPVEPLIQRVVHRLYTSPTVVAPFANLLLWGESIMFERDVDIWNHKTYIGRPLLVTEDQTITKHRRWYKKFYSEHSPRLDVKQKNDPINDW